MRLVHLLLIAILFLAGAAPATRPAIAPSTRAAAAAGLEFWLDTTDRNLQPIPPPGNALRQAAMAWRCAAARDQARFSKYAAAAHVALTGEVLSTSPGGDAAAILAGAHILMGNAAEADRLKAMALAAPPPPGTIGWQLMLRRAFFYSFAAAGDAGRAEAMIPQGDEFFSGAIVCREVVQASECGRPDDAKALLPVAERAVAGGLAAEPIHRRALRVDLARAKLAVNDLDGARALGKGPDQDVNAAVLAEIAEKQLAAGDKAGYATAIKQALAAATRIKYAVTSEVIYEPVLARAVVRGGGNPPRQLVDASDDIRRESILLGVAEGYARAFDLPACRNVMKRLEVKPVYPDELYDRVYPEIAGLFFQHGDDTAAREVLTRIPDSHRRGDASEVLALVHLKAGKLDDAAQAVKECYTRRDRAVRAGCDAVRAGLEEQLRLLLDRVPPYQRVDLAMGAVDAATRRWPKLD